MKKRVAVIGLGYFGAHTASRLYGAGHDVLGIDANISIVERHKDSIGYTVCANAQNKEDLESLSIREYDAVVVGVGQDITASILVALHLKELGVENIIVRAISDDHAKVLEKLGIRNIVYPEKEMAERIASMIGMRNALDYLPLTDDYGIVEVKPPRSFLGSTLAELKITSRFACQVLGIKYGSLTETKDDDKIKMAPSAADIVPEGATLIVLGKTGDIDRLQRES